MRLFEGRTADEVWLSAARDFSARTGTREQPSRDGATLEIPQAIFVISEPRQRWVFSRTPATNIALALAEVVWILRGRDDSAFLIHWSKAYAEYAGDAPHLHGAYGYRLRTKQGLDQIERAYLALKNKPHTRQVVLQIWDAASDLPHEDGRERGSDIPCNLISMLKVRGGKLEWTQVIRSNDLYRGVPFNFVQFTTLQEIMAGWLGVEPGQFTQLSDSLHVYAREIELIAQSSPVPNFPLNDDTLSLPKEESDRAFAELEARIEKVAHARTAQQIEHVFEASLPRSLANFLAVFCAETARRLHLCFWQLGLAHFGSLIWPTPWDVEG